MNDDNWYVDQQPAKPSRQKDYLWLWLLIGITCVILGGLGLIWWVAEYIEQQGGFQQWADSINSFDDTLLADLIHRRSGLASRLLNRY